MAARPLPNPKGLRVIDETTAEAEARYEEVVSNASVDRRLLSGPFASNVWGGRYEIDGIGGEGSQGTTFTGVDRKTGARVAVKLFDLGKAKDWKAQELFEREVATLKRLSHAGVPSFVDVVVDEDTGCRALVMTQIPGESLKAVLAREKVIPEKRLWTLLVDVANVMAYVHGEGIVHRDLKPENLVQKPDGSVAVVDFGGVGVVRAKAGSTVVGTFGFMAPEQLYGAQVPATDLYALGATILTLATGRSPEDQPRDGLHIDVDEAAPFLSEHLRALLDMLLSPDPSDRPKDAAALLVELKRIASAPATTTTTTTTTTATQKQKGSVDAIWRDEAENGMAALEGGLGIIASIVGMLATVGLGRVVVPMILTIIAAFTDAKGRKNLEDLKRLVEKRSQQLQEEMKKQGLRHAQNLEQLNEKERGRRKERRDAGQETRRQQRRQKKQEKRQEWWK